MVHLLTIPLMYGEVRSTLVLMGCDGGIRGECKVAAEKSEQTGEDGGGWLRVYGGVGWIWRGSLCCTACCLPENEQTSDYDVNANLNVSQ